MHPTPDRLAPRSLRALVGIACAIACALTTCAVPPPPSSLRAPAAAPSRAVLRARVPDAPQGPLAPSPARVANGVTLPPDALAAVERCSVCHADVFDQWSRSAHRYSSLDNPFYAPAFDAARAAGGASLGRWCGGCHDPGLLFAGDLATMAPVDRVNDRARLGVGCLLCHSVERLHDRTGNGNYELTAAAVPMPRRAGDGFADVAPHALRMGGAALRTAELCGSCHKVGLSEAVNGTHWLRGQNDFDAWEQSAFAGNDLLRHDPAAPRQSCRDCHMPLEPVVRGDAAAHEGRVRSHRFLGGHTTLAAWNGDDDTLARARALLTGAVQLDLFRAPGVDGAGAAPLEESAVVAGSTLAFDAVLVNERVGHRFPGGTADATETWLEVTVTDGAGRLLAASGAVDARGAVDDDAHRLEVRPLDDRGAPAVLRDPHRFRAVAFDTTLPPRAARVVRYTWEIPAGARGPWTVRARLLHRRLAVSYWAFACALAPAQQGRACGPQPVTEIATRSVVLGAGAAEASIPRWQRFYNHGRALAEAEVQERVGQARGSLDAAIAIAPDAPGPRVELARVAAREGRTALAFMALDDASARGANPSVVSYLRGEAAADVWRFVEARGPLAAAHAGAPANLRAAELYANVLGLAGEHGAALEVIDGALAVDPERAQLQHLQALELDALGAVDEALRAREAYDRYRTPDAAPSLRSRCKREVRGCARETEPVHAHALRAPG